MNPSGNHGLARLFPSSDRCTTERMSGRAMVLLIPGIPSIARWKAAIFLMTTGSSRPPVRPVSISTIIGMAPESRSLTRSMARGRG